MPARPPLAAVRSLAEAGRLREAAAVLVEAARAGDGEALLELAHWRVYGDIVRRDLAAARALFRRAAGAEVEQGALLHAAFLANGSGGPPDWPAAVAALERVAQASAQARAQLALLAAMDLDGEGYPTSRPAAEPVSAAPDARIARGLLSGAECAWLAERARPYLQPSVVVDPATGRMIPNPVRISDGAAFGVLQEDVVVSAINRRIAALTGTGYAAGEPLQLLRYGPGGEYKAHLDALPGNANQRVATVIVYLNAGYEGGETLFCRTGLAIRGAPGDALLFRNVRPDGAPDPLTLHAGLPLRRGEKLIATRWIRAAPFAFPPPEPATGAAFDGAELDGAQS